MNLTAFNKNDNWQKQKDIAIYAISRLKNLNPLEVTAHDYESALALSKLIQRFDQNRDVKEIHVFSYFVRLYRNESGAFRFTPVVIDHFEGKAKEINLGYAPVK